MKKYRKYEIQELSDKLFKKELKVKRNVLKNNIIMKKNISRQELIKKLKLEILRDERELKEIGFNPFFEKQIIKKIDKLNKLKLEEFNNE